MVVLEAVAPRNEFDLFLAALNVVQTIALAFIANCHARARSRRRTHSGYSARRRRKSTRS